jgi:hypothetical protein
MCLLGYSNIVIVYNDVRGDSFIDIMLRIDALVK